MNDNRLSDEDIKRIADAVAETVDHPCRFQRIEPDELQHMFEFYENFNGVLKESRGIFFRTLVRILVLGLFALIGLGSYAKIKEWGGGL